MLDNSISRENKEETIIYNLKYYYKSILLNIYNKYLIILIFNKRNINLIFFKGISSFFILN